MCTIITIFEHTLSDNHGAVDVLLRSTTITVDTHFLDSFIAPSRVAACSLFISLYSLARSACVSYGTRAWGNVKTEYCTQIANTIRFLLHAFQYTENVSYWTHLNIWCIDLLVYFSFTLFARNFCQISCLLALIFGINWFVDGACGMHDNNSIRNIHRTRKPENSPKKLKFTTCIQWTLEHL